MWSRITRSSRYCPVVRRQGSFFSFLVALLNKCGRLNAAMPYLIHGPLHFPPFNKHTLSFDFWASTEGRAIAFSPPPPSSIGEGRRVGPSRRGRARGAAALLARLSLAPTGHRAACGRAEKTRLLFYARYPVSTVALRDISVERPQRVSPLALERTRPFRTGKLGMGGALDGCLNVP